MSVNPGKCCDKKEKVWKTGVDQSITDLKRDVLYNATEISELMARTEGIENIKTNAITSIAQEANDSNLVLILRREGYETYLPLVIADENTTGVMNAPTYRGIVKNTMDIEILKNATFFFIDSTNSLKEGLTTEEIYHIYFQQYPDIELRDSVSFQNADGSYALQYSKQLDAWFPRMITNINMFLNGLAGVIVGSTKDGQVFAEIDGTGSVVGWDYVKSKADLVDNKVDKSTITTILHGTNSLGQPAVWKFYQQPQQLSMVQRGVGGEIFVRGNPDKLNEAVGKEYVDREIDTRVPLSTNPNILYGTDSSGETFLRKVDGGPIGGTIPIRAANGNIQIGITPTSSYDATSKQYVDGRDNTLIDNINIVNTNSENRDTHLDNRINSLSTTVGNQGNVIMKRVWAHDREGGAKPLGSNGYVFSKQEMINRDLREGDIVFLHIHRDNGNRMIATGVWSETTMGMYFTFEPGSDLGSLAYIGRIRIQNDGNVNNRKMTAEIARVSSEGVTNWETEPTAGRFNLLYIYRLRMYHDY